MNTHLSMEKIRIASFRIQKLRKLALVFLIFAFTFTSTAKGTEIYIGSSEADITPELPVALQGQFYLRIGHTARTPLLANIVALESRDGALSTEQTVFVACDLVFIPDILTELVRKQVKEQIPELDVRKIVLSATHTHTSPVIESGFYEIPKQGVSQPEAYQQLFAQRVAAAIVKAWKSRKAGSVSWGLGTATIAHNRRAVYTDGTARMYGSTNLREFQSLEGYEDHDVNTLFFWNKAGKLIATSIDVPCPAQELESATTVDADYWHAVRVSLKKRFGADLVVVGWIGAAGDQSPHLMYRKKAEERMRSLSKLSRIDVIAQRIVNAVVETYETVKNDRYSDVLLTHKVERLALPMRIITETEYLDSKAVSNAAAAKIVADPGAAESELGRKVWYGDIVTRYEMQQTTPNPIHDAEIHVVRLGDIVICTNQFELFTDFGIRMQTRSKALQTFVVQLAGPGTYLPTSKAKAGGGYSAVCQSNLVGPEGGQILVDRTVELIDELWH